MKILIMLLLLMTSAMKSNNNVLPITTTNTTESVKKENVNVKTEKSPEQKKVAQERREREKVRQKERATKRKEKENKLYADAIRRNGIYIPQVNLEPEDSSTLHETLKRQLAKSTTTSTVIKNIEKLDGVNFVLSQYITSLSQMGVIPEINSGIRNKWHHRKCSKHFHGNAVDLKYDTELIDLMISEEGRSLAQKMGVQFFIEHKYSGYKKRIKKAYQPYWRHVAWATGLHIHVETIGNDG